MFTFYTHFYFTLILICVLYVSDLNEKTSIVILTYIGRSLVKIEAFIEKTSKLLLTLLYKALTQASLWIIYNFEFIIRGKKYILISVKEKKMQKPKLDFLIGLLKVSKIRKQIVKP